MEHQGYMLHQKNKVVYQLSWLVTALGSFSAMFASSFFETEAVKADVDA